MPVARRTVYRTAMPVFRLRVSADTRARKCPKMSAFPQIRIAASFCAGRRLLEAKNGENEHLFLLRGEQAVFVTRKT